MLQLAEMHNSEELMSACILKVWWQQFIIKLLIIFNSYEIPNKKARMAEEELMQEEEFCEEILEGKVWFCFLIDLENSFFCWKTSFKNKTTNFGDTKFSRPQNWPTRTIFWEIFFLKIFLENLNVSLFNILCATFIKKILEYFLLQVKFLLE